MGYTFNYNDSLNYQKWYNNSNNKLIVDLQSKLLLEMLQPLPGRTIIDIGCGIGINFNILIEKGLLVTGIDPSSDMLTIALTNACKKVDLYNGFAEDLPFADNSFNYSSIITTLEFVNDPKKAIAEACRVTKDKIFIGILNKFSTNSIRIRIKGMFVDTIYNKANFFSIWKIKKIIYELLGDVPVYCKNPFGDFSGILVKLVPRFRTTPLPISYNAKAAADFVT